MSRRFLVMGDNHGDTESLRRVRADVAGETFDFAVHVGDFTNAVRATREQAAAELRAVEPLLADIADRARHGLLWVYGNRDYFGDVGYDLDVGTEVPDEGCVTVGGQRFTSDLDAVADDVVLVTHMERVRLLDHFEGRAHFCGNTHLGRHLDRRLNSAFLQETPRDGGDPRYGGYFVAEVGADGLDVELRSVGDLRRVECPEHRERGVQFLPADWDCTYCEDRDVLLRELAASAFYGCAAADGRDTASREAVVEYALDRLTDPPVGLRAALEEYLAGVDDQRYSALTTTEDGRLAVAENSYAY